ncbi:hypothetical protein [Variovorax sp. KK3]|uniref:hypothetical protein n=1 Tax=Variovorax sp. KK3 TaxID=1855728 RepID=UPI00117FE045|nr:hypothetical protein [Variovorax sp. KK3]
MKRPHAMTPVLVKDESLIEPALHDARLCRIDFGGKQVTCYFEDPSGQRIKLDMHDVVQMSSHGLAEANILLDISVETGPAVRHEIVERLISGSSPVQEKHRGALIARLLSRELSLIQFSPSYGGEITVICKTMSYCTVDV